MVLENDLKLRIEPNVFGLIKIRALLNGNFISLNSIQLPSDLRQLSRYLHNSNQVVGMLIDFLDSHPNFPLQVKVNNSVVDCVWDSKFIVQNKVVFDFSDNEIKVSPLSKIGDKFVFAKKFCLDLSQSKLGLFEVYEDVLSQRLFNYVQDNFSMSKMPLKSKQDKLTTLSMSFADFNLHSDMFLTHIDDKSFMFMTNHHVVEPVMADAVHVLDVSYDVNDVLVKISPKICCDLNKISVSRFFFMNCFDLSFDWLHDLTEKQSKFVLKGLLRYFNSTNEIFKLRCLTHFLVKPFKNKQHLKAFIDCIEFISSNSIQYRILILDGSFVWTKINVLVEFKVALELFSLFHHSIIDKNNDDKSIIVSKEQFHLKLGYLEKTFKKMNLDIHFGDTKIEIEDHNLVLDFRNVDDFSDQPKLFFDDEFVSEETLKQFEENSWSYVLNDTVNVLNPKMVAKVKEILNILKLKKNLKVSSSSHDIVRSLHLLDWIQIQQLGVKLLLSSEQQRLVDMFLTFKETTHLKPPSQLKSKPRSYQVQSLGWFEFIYKFKLGGVLADDMGLGKTFQTIMFLALIKEGKISNNCPSGQHLIVVPPSLLFNWEYEIATFYPNLSVDTYSGVDRYWNKDVDIVLLTYDVLRRDIESLCEKKINVLVFDEAQLLKNKLSERSKSASRIDSSCVLCLTGTPIENNMLEYYTIIQLIVPNLFGSYSIYSDLVKQKKFNQIINRSKPFILRRLKSDILLDLPKKVEQSIYLNCSDSQKDYYQALVSEVKSKLASQDKKNTSQMVILNLLLRLRQVCISPYLLDNSYNEMTPKFIFLKERLNILKSEGYSALIFSQFTKSLDLAETLCKNENIDYFRLDGSTPLKKRKDNISQFQSSSKSQVFLISLKAGGMGLNLTKASYVFHLDPWWNPAVETQATDRTHRIGQDKQVFVFRLAMHNTIEEKMLSMNDEKKKLFNLFFEDSQIVKRKELVTSSDLMHLLESM